MARNSTRSWWPQATTRPLAAAAARSRFGVGDGDRDGLLDIDRLAGGDRGQGLLGVEDGRRGDGHHVHRVQEGVQIAEGAPAQGHGHARRPVRVGVETPDRVTPGRRAYWRAW